MARALYHTFFANYGKNREKAYELYFSGKRTSSLEKVIEMECLPEIVNETGKSTNMPYLRGGECPLRKYHKVKYFKKSSQKRFVIVFNDCPYIFYSVLLITVILTFLKNML